MSANEIKKNTEQKMTKSIESLKSNLQKIRTGRAHPGILEQINVDYYGNPTPIGSGSQLRFGRCQDIDGSALGKKT